MFILEHHVLTTRNLGDLFLLYTHNLEEKTLSTPTSEKTECEAVTYWLINEIIVWLLLLTDYQLEWGKPGFWSHFNSPELQA